MTDLKDCQTHFQNYIFSGKKEAILPEITDDHLSAVKRLDIYYQGYRLRLLQILKETFPKTHILMGEEDFSAAFIRYLDKNPPIHYNVRYFGQDFSHFLAHEPPFSAFPLLAEMAAFEWGLLSTLDAPDSPVISPTDLGQVPPEKWGDLTFRLHPSVLCLSFEWDTPPLWLHIEEDLPPRAAEKQLSPILWLLWRKDIKSLFQSCNETQAELFQQLQAGNTFADMCDSLTDKLEENQIPVFSAQTLYQWVQAGMIAALG